MGMFSSVNTRDILEKIDEVEASIKAQMQSGKTVDFLTEIEKIRREVRDCQRVADMGY